MKMPSRWLAPAMLAAVCAAVAFVAPAHEQDPMLCMRVDSPEVVVLDGIAYYRDCDRRADDRPEVRRDPYGRPIYFRFIPLDKHPVRDGSSNGDQRGDDRSEVRRDAYGRPIYFRFIPLDKHPMHDDSSHDDQLHDHLGQEDR